MSKTIYSYFNGEIVPLADAKISIMTHAFNYGTACFEGIRAYWNEQKQQLYAFRMLEHYQRLAGSTRIMSLKLPHTPDRTLWHYPPIAIKQRFSRRCVYAPYLLYFVRGYWREAARAGRGYVYLFRTIWGLYGYRKRLESWC